MFRRLVPLLALALIAALPAGSALATTPGCTAVTGTLRYKPEYTASCPGQTIVSVELVKTSNGATVGTTSDRRRHERRHRRRERHAGLEHAVPAQADGRRRHRRGALDADLPDAQGARQPEPARQVHHRDPGRRRARHGPPHRPRERRRGADERRLHRRLDPEPLRRRPTPPRSSTTSRRSSSPTEKVLNTAGLGSALTKYCNAKHGVVVAGQTHWLAGGAGWTQESAIGQQGGAWEKHWSLYYYEDITAERATGGGDLAPGLGAEPLPDQGPHQLPRLRPRLGRGRAARLRTGARPREAQGAELGLLQHLPTAQFLLSEHQIDAGRVVDLGFRPWSKDVSGRRVRPGPEPRRLADRPRALVGDEPHPADEHALHVEAAQHVDARRP